MDRVKILILILLILVGVFHGYCQENEVKVIKAKGVASLEGKSRAMAVDEAVMDAKRNAIEQAVGVYVSSQTLVRNFQLVDDTILSKSQGYITEWEKIKESSNMGLLEVVIQAKVKMGKIKNDVSGIKRLIEEKNPHVMIAVREKIGKSGYRNKFQNNYISQAENKLKDVFLNYKVIIKEPTLSKNGKRAVMYLFNEDFEPIKKVAKERGIDLIIFGEAVAFASSFRSGDMVSYQSDINLKAVELDTGNIIASASAHGADINMNRMTGMKNAIADASKKAGEEIIRDCVNWWKDSLSGKGYKLEISLVSDKYESVEKFISNVESNIRGINRISILSFEGNNAKLEIESMVKGNNFVRELLDKDFFEGKINKVTENTIDIDLTVKPEEDIDEKNEEEIKQDDQEAIKQKEEEKESSEKVKNDEMKNKNKEKNMDEKEEKEKENLE